MPSRGGESRGGASAREKLQIVAVLTTMGREVVKIAGICNPMPIRDLT